MRSVGRDLQYEARADIASIEDDVHDIRDQAEKAPYDFLELWDDALKDFKILKADVTTDARIAARRIATLIKTA